MNVHFPQFDPPYDSPIQDRLAWDLHKYLSQDTNFVKEKEVVTKVSDFRIDLVLDISGQRAIGIECDGRDFHDPLTDLFRDALILGSSNISAIYRFPGRVLTSFSKDALFLLSLWEPDFFNQRIVDQRDLLASDEVKSAFENKSWDSWYPYLFEWQYKGEQENLSAFVIRHRFGLKDPYSDSIDRIWEFSKNGTYTSIDALAEAFAAQYPTRDWRGSSYYWQHDSRLFERLDARHYKKSE